MTLYRALAQLGRLLMEFAEREIERREQAPTPIVVRVRYAWDSRQFKKVEIGGQC